ncbi:MAG: transporter [Steroidobacteraceae bacterium]
MVPKAGVVPAEPIWITNLGQSWFDGSISGNSQVPIAGQSSVGLDAKFSLTLATVVKVWDTGPGAWNFASGATVSYISNDVSAMLAVQGLQGPLSQSAYGLFDLYLTPIVAGYHISGDQHVALSVNIWAPTGSYDATRIANASLNTWTFIPQIAYTKLWPDAGWEFDAVGSVQFYTRNSDTDYQNAPLLTLDLMGLKHFDNGWSAGVITGTVQQLAKDSGPTAVKLDGFVGHDWTIGPILTYDTKLASRAPLSFSLRWVPTIASHNRLDSPSTVLGTATLMF